MKIIESKNLVIVRTSGSVLDIGSYNCQELGLAKALCLKGWKVTLILAGLQDEKQKLELGSSIIEIYRMRFKSFGQALASFENIFPLLESLKPDCIQIHEFGMWMSFKITRWARNKKIPVFLIQGSYQTTQKLLFKQLEQSFNRIFGVFVLNNVSAIGCKSKMAEQYVHSYCKRKTMLTPIGLDEERFQGSKHIGWRRDLFIDNKKVLLYVGILEQRRNPFFLLDVIRQLPEEYILLMVGSGPMDKEVRNYISKTNLQNKCIMMGKLEQWQLPSLYASADAFLLASNYEIYGMVLLEALYFGLPVVTTFTAGSDMLIEQGKNGYILDKDVDLWVNKIRLLFEDKTCYEEMKLFAYQNINQNFVWKKAVNNFIKLYCSCDQ